MDKKKIISLEIPAYLREALRKKAFNEDTTISALIRQILEEQLKDIIKETKDKNQEINMEDLKNKKLLVIVESPNKVAHIREYLKKAGY